MAVNKVIYNGATLVDLTGDTVTAADLADGVKATGADGNPIVGLMQKVAIDAELSTTSTNPVQNKAIYNALLNKVGTDIFSGFTLLGGATKIMWREGTQFIGSINAANYSGTARVAIHDGDGNVINTTYAKKSDISGMVKSVNGTTPDASGNVTVTVPAKVSDLELDIPYARTDVPTTFTGPLTATTAIFGTCSVEKEDYYMQVTTGYNTVTPTKSTMLITAKGNLTLDMTHVTPAATGRFTVFTAYILSSADYTLTITKVDSIKYIGEASDLAITSAGLLLNIAIVKNSIGYVTAIVQANKLRR